MNAFFQPAAVAQRETASRIKPSLCRHARLKRSFAKFAERAILHSTRSWNRAAEKSRLESNHVN